MRSLLTLLVSSSLGLALSHPAFAQSDAGDRQAAAEAYDRGTAAYLRQEYEEAAQWFETANRMSPAAPALMQAVRAHQNAGNGARAATLALRLSERYSDEQAAADYANSVLSDLADKYLRIDVSCDGCRLDLDGTLQEFHSFFLEPGSVHTLEAHFQTGKRSTEISGEAGETQAIEFDAPPPPPDTGEDDDEPSDDGTIIDDGVSGKVDTDGKPLQPIFTYIGAGITGALLIGSVISTLDMNSGVTDFEDAAAEATAACAEPNPSPDCDSLFEDAQDKLEEGQSKETRTTILWVATGVAAAGTAVIALVLTDWSGGEDSMAFGVSPTPGGAFARVEGRF